MPCLTDRSRPHLLRLLVTLSVLCGVWLSWAPHSANPAHADDPEERDHRGEDGPRLSPGTVQGEGDPVARLWVYLKKVHVRSDNDLIFGSGELHLEITLSRCTGGTKESCADRTQREYVDGYATDFSADSGDDVTLTRVFPLDAFPGEHYRIHTELIERDHAGDTVGLSSDRLGEVFWTFGEADGWRLGTHTAISIKEEARQRGDYDLEIEISHAPFPDLRPVSVTVNDLPAGTAKLVCMAFENAGPVDAGPFEVALRVDGVVPAGARAAAGRLPAGATGEQCVETPLSANEQHQLAVVIDEARALTEVNELNNVFEQPYPRIRAIGSNEFSSAGSGVHIGSNEFSSGGATSATPTPTASPTPSPSATPTPSQARPDLTIGAIRVNGRAPDGKDDCKDGKNDVAVVVKNTGTAGAGAFVVRLAVDGEKDQIPDKAVPGLDAGQEREIRFDDVRLKKGEHKLEASADAGKAVAETDEGNNTRTVAARCKDDD